MSHDFGMIGSGGAGASEPALSPEAHARKRELLPVLQGQLARRRVRREAITGGAVATAAAVLVAAGAMATLRGQPGEVWPVDHEQTAALPGPGPEQTPSHQPSYQPSHQPSGPARPRAVNFALVRNDPSLVERHRIDDVRLVQELRSAGYEAGLVRTADRVFIMMNER
jgi:hypothetical protein